MGMVEVKTAELEGSALDWAIWRAERGEPGEPNPKTGYIWTDLNEHWCPSTNWSQGGPLIEKYRMGVQYGFVDYWVSTYMQNGIHVIGKTALIAACRAIAAAKLGDTVSIPTELLK